MKGLREKGLLFGDLVKITAPDLVARYNRALRYLTGRETRLGAFHLDISGHSPEVGEEFGDALYLNREGHNRQFILLSPAQRHAPLLQARYSTSRAILRQFIDANESDVCALTARGVVAGELLNSDFSLQSFTGLQESRSITIRADVIGGPPGDAKRLAALIARFQTEPEGWRDETLIAEMIALSQPTGEATQAPLALPEMTFEQPNFWTSDFGGAYVFRRARLPVTILSDPAATQDRPPPGRLLSTADRNALADWLTRNGLVEMAVAARGPETAALLRQKMDFILLAEAERLGLPLRNADRLDLRRSAGDLGPNLPDAWRGLSEVLRWAEAGGRWPEISSEDSAYFHLLRAAPGPDRELVEMLLAELAALDLRRLHLFHLPMFLRQHEGWSADKRRWVEDFLMQERELDQTGARAALYGPEPEMDAAPRSAVSQGRVAPMRAAETRERSRGTHG